MEITIKCPHCDTVYHRYERFKTHFKKIHNINLEDDSPCPDKIVVKCIKDDIINSYL